MIPIRPIAKGRSLYPSPLLYTLLALVACHALEAADNTPPPGFTALFNGRDFTGWKVPQGDGGHWRIVDGVIDYDAESQASGDKSLWTEREFGDFTLHVDWRIKETPYVNPNVPYILPDGTHARDIHGKEMKLALPDSDSGILLRGSGRNQINIWCWPIGSGEMYGYRMDRNQPPAVRAAATPRTQADKPVGEWNHYEITVKGDRVTVLLNGRKVIDNAQMPGVAAKGPVGLQHHGSKRDGKWNSPPSLLQFKNIYVMESAGSASASQETPAAGVKSDVANRQEKELALGKLHLKWVAANASQNMRALYLLDRKDTAATRELLRFRLDSDLTALSMLDRELGLDDGGRKTLEEGQRFLSALNGKKQQAEANADNNKFLRHRWAQIRNQGLDANSANLREPNFADLVAQICNLLYRGIAFCEAAESNSALLWLRLRWVVLVRG